MTTNSFMCQNPIGIYVHIPYCIKKCPYCDFNSYAVGAEPGSSMPEERYLQALLSEIRHYAPLPEWAGRTCRSVFIGGGTPSLFSPASIAYIISEIRSRFELPASAEVTLEANPGTIHEELACEKLHDFRVAGVNRISMGAQSFYPQKLKLLGRLHSADETRSAVANIKAAGFDNFNLDLIFGVGAETSAEWTNDLRTAISLQPPHLSAYCLTIEPGTEFSRLDKQGSLSLPSDEAQAEMFTLTQQMLDAHGYVQYEISNYSKPGFACRHNLGYWNGDDYLGLGAGAHSYRQEIGGSNFGTRWSNIPGPEHYIQRASAGEGVVQRSEQIDREKAELEFFFLGLRTSQGVSASAYCEYFEQDLEESYGVVVRGLLAQGLLEKAHEHFRLTSRGFLFADEVLRAFAQGGLV